MPRILILESYLPTGQACEVTLKREGWDVTLSQTVQATLEALQDNRYDALLVDLDIPTGDGWCLLETLYRTDDPAPIIAMLDLESSQHQRAQALGVYLVLSKPIDRGTLLASASAVLDHV